MAESTEARASLNFKGVTAKGWDVLFTLRDDDEKALVLRFGEFVKLLEETYHVTPHGVQSKATQPAAPAASVPAAAEAVPGKQDVGIGHYDDWFEAEKLVASLNKGKVFFKVQGGRFVQYGVVIWPEGFKQSPELDPKILEAQYRQAVLEGDDIEWGLTGYKAYYVTKLNDNGEVVPDKVIALLK